MNSVIHRSCSNRRSSAAFTLVELLVSISIIGVLVSMIIPAAQSAREAARRVQCQNNLKQIGLALHSFYDAQRVFPASGWTQAGPGNPAGAFVSWQALLLPHLEQKPLHGSYDFSANWWNPANLAAGNFQIGTYICPSVPEQRPIVDIVAKSPRPTLVLDAPLARSDYAAVMGVRQIIAPDIYKSAEITRSILFRNSRIRFADVLDGTSNTIAISETAARPNVYRARRFRGDLSNDQGNGWIDSESGYSLDGSSPDGEIVGQGPSLSPRAINATNENEPYSFHLGGALFVFADGHVQFISESVPLEIFAGLVTRSGGEISPRW